MKLVFSIVGSGNMAKYFAHQCYKNNWKIEEFISRNETEGKLLAKKYNANFKFFDEEISINSTIVLLAIPDKIILDWNENKCCIDKTILITAGGIGLQQISNLSKNTISMWPLFSILNNIDVLDKKDIPFVLQSSNEESKLLADEIAKKISTNVFYYSDEQKLKLHLAAVFANNFTTHIIGIAQELLKENKINPEILNAILEQTFANAKNGNAFESQTGPAIRNDISTMNAHLELLNQDNNASEIYKLLSNSIFEKSKKMN